MSERRDFDCIVVGAGPAGSILAGGLARGGLDVLILEKEALPRYKACGGGITVKAANMLRDVLGLDLAGCIEDRITGIHVTHRGTDRLDLHSDNPLTYMVQREIFDEYLTRKAMESGASLLQRTVDGVGRTDNGFAVHTGSGDLRAGFVIGADGATSVVAKALGLASHRRMAAAIEAELDPGPERLAKFRSRMVIDYGAAHYGYGWVFPKADHLSVGVGSFVGKSSLAKELDELIRREGLTEARAIVRKGHLIPTWAGSRPLHVEGALLVGDAARVVDPFTGEGIHSAVLSAIIAGETILGAVSRSNRDLSGYSKRIASELGPHLQVASTARRVFYPFSGAWHRFLRTNPAIYCLVIKLVQGQADYHSLAHLLKGSLKEVIGARR